MKKFVKGLKIAANVFLWLFVVFSVIVTVVVLTAQSNVDGLPSFGGNYVVNILSDSMSPTFKEGDMIIGERLTEDARLKLNIGDVITYWTGLDGDGRKELNTHRIVEINEDENLGYVVSYITQGDNKVTNPTPDAEPVKTADIISRWNGKKIPVVGSVVGFLQTSQNGFLLVIVLPLLAFFLFELFRFFKTLASVRGGKKQISAAEEELIKQKAIEEYLKNQAAAVATTTENTENTEAITSDNSTDSQAD